ncbi:fimbrial protein [Rahnella selenatireducens]|uniref:fimbrial protein n=1 Tax=Rahnella selenatireducens TaxID=3389797 RepID=UPI0039693079
MKKRNDMNKYISLRLASIAICGTLASTAMAADSTIKFTATIISPTCTISADSKSVSIPLGEVQASTLTAAKSASSWSSNYTLNLTGCPSITTKVNATFSGTADADDTNGYINATTTGAKNVSVQLAKTDGTTFLKNGAKYGDVTVDNGNASFTVKARMYSTKGSATLGAVTAPVEVTFTFS